MNSKPAFAWDRAAASMCFPSSTRRCSCCIPKYRGLLLWCASGCENSAGCKAATEAVFPERSSETCKFRSACWYRPGDVRSAVDTDDFIIIVLITGRYTPRSALNKLHWAQAFCRWHELNSALPTAVLHLRSFKKEAPSFSLQISEIQFSFLRM